MKEKIKFYKPKILITGIILFGISTTCIGMLYATKFFTNEGVGINDTWYITGIIISFLALFIGEGLILDAASYKVRLSETKRTGGEK